MGAIDFVSVGEEEPEVTKGLIWDEFKLGESVLVSGGLRKVGNEGLVGGL